jgi:transcriptional regulator with XRE-family HTH domain
MTPEIMLAWRNRMGLDVLRACEKIGCHRNAWAAWEHGERRIPRYIGLAMAAVEAGLVEPGLRRRPKPAKD